mgnify:FL=1
MYRNPQTGGPASITERDRLRRAVTSPAGRPLPGRGPAECPATWSIIGGEPAARRWESAGGPLGSHFARSMQAGRELTRTVGALAECYPETLQSLATDLAHHGQTVADVLRIEHVRPGGRRIVVYMSDGRACRAYALDGEGSCGVCSGRGTDPHEPGLPCVACEGSCEPSDAQLDDRAADHA